MGTRIETKIKMIKVLYSNFIYRFKSSQRPEVPEYKLNCELNIFLQEETTNFIYFFKLLKTQTKFIQVPKF